MHFDDYELNYTMNVSGMWWKALGLEMKDLDGRKCSDCTLYLSGGITEMNSYPEIYQKMNPDNGWGDYKGARGVLQELLDWCNENPDHRLYISH